VSRQLGFRFKNVFSTSGLFFVEKRRVFRFEDPGAPRGEKKANKKYARASFLLAVGRQSAELGFGGSPLGSHGGGMPARSGGSWSTGGEGKFMPPTELLWHNQKQRRQIGPAIPSSVFVVDGASRAGL
jgi:hypothetical protein